MPAASGSSGYTEDEKRVLNHTSNINDNIFVPFMDVDLKDRFVFPIPFNDKVRKSLLKFCFFFSFKFSYFVFVVVVLVGWYARIGTETEA